MPKRFLMIALALLSFGVQAFSQATVTGKVTDAKGEAIVGAGVVVKGTSSGAMTDLDGKYSISNVPSTATLVFSCVGYDTQEVLVGSQKVINVVLAENAEFLDDVVVVAYGTARKRDLTGSISTVQNKTITTQAQGSVTRSLEGAVPGLQTQAIDGQPGLDMGIRIRGIGTASPNNSNALIVIDGAPALDGTNVLSSLNSQDIESITVLKDAASTALYGSRGANGVILVTTKNGKAGKTKVSFQSRVGINAMGGNSRFTKIGDKGAYEIYGRLSTMMLTMASAKTRPSWATRPLLHSMLPHTCSTTLEPLIPKPSCPSTPVTDSVTVWLTRFPDSLSTLPDLPIRPLLPVPLPALIS